MIPIIYLYFHSKILRWKGKEMKIKEFKSSFFQWRIPKNLRDLIMKEMETKNLIKVKKNTVFLNDYYLNEEKFEQDTIKDPDTKKESPYIENL